MEPSFDMKILKAFIDTMTPSGLVEIQYRVRERRATHCRFLQLPAELRDRLYYFAALNAFPAHPRDRESPPMLMVCRQVRKEFSDIYSSDKIMTVELVDLSWREWRRLKDVVVLKALLGLNARGRNEEFNAWFGGRGPVVYFRHSLQGTVEPGDVEQARILPEIFRHSTRGNLICAAATSLKPLRLWQEREDVCPEITTALLRAIRLDRRDDSNFWASVGMVQLSGNGGLGWKHSGRSRSRVAVRDQGHCSKADKPAVHRTSPHRLISTAVPQ